MTKNYIQICMHTNCENQELCSKLKDNIANIPIEEINCLGSCKPKSRIDILYKGQLTKYGAQEIEHKGTTIIKPLGTDPLETIIKTVSSKNKMKIGLIHSLKADSPLTKVYNMLCTDIAKLETIPYESDTFTPDYIKQDSLDYLLFYSTKESDDGLAKAIYKHTTVPLLYHLTPNGYTNTQKRYDQLNEAGIEVYLFLPTENYRTTQDLIERLKKLGA